MEGFGGNGNPSAQNNINREKRYLLSSTTWMRFLDNHLPVENHKSLCEEIHDIGHRAPGQGSSGKFWGSIPCSKNKATLGVTSAVSSLEIG